VHIVKETFQQNVKLHSFVETLSANVSHENVLVIIWRFGKMESVETEPRLFAQLQLHYQGQKILVSKGPNVLEWSFMEILQKLMSQLLKLGFVNASNLLKL
jgi:hypothetical protein